MCNVKLTIPRHPEGGTIRHIDTRKLVFVSGKRACERSESQGSKYTALPCGFGRDVDGAIPYKPSPAGKVSTTLTDEGNIYAPKQNGQPMVAPTIYRSFSRRGATSPTTFAIHATRDDMQCVRIDDIQPRG